MESLLQRQLIEQNKLRHDVDYKDLRIETLEAVIKNIDKILLDDIYDAEKWLEEYDDSEIKEDIKRTVRNKLMYLKALHSSIENYTKEL